MGPYWILLAIVIAASFAVPVAVFIVVPSALPGQGTPAPRLVISVATDNESYAPGQAVIVTVSVKNAGDAVTSISFGSTCQASYTVFAMDGSSVYDHREHLACGLILTNLSLKPGDSRLFTFPWNQVTDQGIPVPTLRSYSIQGVLLSSKPLLSPSPKTTIFITSPSHNPDLAFVARTDRASYGPGESANVTVILTNIGLEPVEMRFPAPCYVQFVVLDESRVAVYNSSKWVACVQVVADIILAPGESRSSTFRWDLTADGGEPLVIGQQYEVVPSFLWAYADPYQRYVSRTDVATFTMAAFTV